MIRLAERVMLNWQFKNFKGRVSKQEMEAEAAKCSIDGWQVYLVMFCTGGHDLDGGSDASFVHAGVTVIALSRDSAERFLGARFFGEVESAGGRRLGACSSPLKAMYKRKYETLSSAP